MLDANVCLDFLLRRQNYAVTKQVFQRIATGEISAHITPTIFHITGYFLSKYYSREQTKDILLNFLLDIKIDEASYEIIVNALTSRMTDIEAAMQYYTALHHKINYFLTFDKEFQKVALPILPVYSPNEFLGLFYN